MLKRSQYLGPSCGIAPGNSAGKVVCAVQCQSRSIWQPSLGDLVAPGHDSLAEPHALPEQMYTCYLLGLGLALWRPRPLPIKRSRVGPPFAECAPGHSRMAEPYVDQRYMCYLLGLGLSWLRPPCRPPRPFFALLQCCAEAAKSLQC